MNDDLGQGSLREQLHAWRLMLGVAWRASRWRAVAAIVSSSTEMLWAPAFALVMTAFTNGVVNSDSSQTRQAAILGAVVLAVNALVSGVSFPMRMHLRELTTHQIDLDLVELAAGIHAIEHFERPEFADRLETLRGTRYLLAAAFDALTLNIAVLVSIAASLSVLAAVDPILLLLPVCGLPAIALSHRSTARTERVRESVMPHLRLFRAVFSIGVSPVAAKELRVFGADKLLRERHHVASRAFERTWMRAGVRNGVDAILGRTIFVAGMTAALFVLLRSAARGHVSAGELAGAVTLAGSIQSLVGQVAQMASWARSCADAARRYAWLDAHARGRPTVGDDVAIPGRISDCIRLEHVTFRYPGTDEDVLVDADLRLPAGATVAIVGDNGAGKTTLVKLLTRMYAPTDGRILIDGHDTQSMRHDDYRRRVTACFQDYAQFELALVRSVGTGHLDHIDDRRHVGSALERAAAEDVPLGLPDGVDTQLGKRFADGHELSGGQWQKLALARAMMRPDPLVLILDEPTAALDAEAEHRLFDRYTDAAHETRSRTGGITVLVSHRFSTVRSADLIVVVADRRIAEVGTHEDLMSIDGVYAELYRLQASSYS